MKKPPYTKKRGNIWWYRRPVPARLQSIIGKVEFAWSLETSDMAEARPRAALRNAEVEGMLSAAKARLTRQVLDATPATPQTLTPELLQYARDAVRAHVLREDELVRREGPDLDSLDEYESIRADQFEETGSALRTGRTERLRIDEALQAIGVSVPRMHPARDEVAYAVTEGHHSALLAIRERMNGEYVPTPAPLPKPAELAAAQPERGVLLLLGAVIDDYITKQEKTPTEFTRKVKRCLQLFGAIVGRSTPVAAVRQKTVTDFLGTICELPLEWAKQYDKGVTVAKLLQKSPDKAMSPTTYKDNYRAPLGTFLKRARRDYGDDGFPALTVEDIEYSGSRAADEEKQRALTAQELKVLFEGEAFRSVANDPEQLDLYWFAVALLFTGARPRELCQLNPQVDILELAGVWHMHISAHTTAGAGITKKVKTGEERKVPVHAELVRLGFLEFVQHRKDAGADRLFQSFRVKGGNPFSASGELFSDLLRAADLYTRDAAPGKLVTGAYCLRKSFITQAFHQRVVSRKLTGHADDGTTRMQRVSYITEDEELQATAQELEKLVMPVTVPRREQAAG